MPWPLCPGGAILPRHCRPQRRGGWTG
jgi:hypothetical protein